MDEIFRHNDHRPWPLPERRWAMAMRWYDLLFAHWPVKPDVLQPLVPGGLRLDTFDGWAWIGVVPFRMEGVRPRYVPERPFAFAFPELNVRTYVTAAGRSGVWFFSLDATSRLAVRAARWWYGLPYYDARIEVVREGETIRYSSMRTHRDAPAAELEMAYGPAGNVFRAGPGTLEHWLTERYCLFTRRRDGRIGAGDVHHRPWPLQPARAEWTRNTMTEPLGIRLDGAPPLLHFARELDVVAWTVRPLDRMEG
jgi:uncharacterized protein